MKLCILCGKEMDSLKDQCCGVSFSKNTSDGEEKVVCVRMDVDVEFIDSTNICNDCALDILQTAAKHVERCIEKNRMKG